MRINRLKSHDYHIWIERLLLVMVRGYLPDQVWQVLVELSFFFRQLCAKELSLKVVVDMERMASVLLCKLEKIFSTRLLQSDAAYDFAPTVRGTNGWARAAPLVLFN